MSHLTRGRRIAALGATGALVAAGLAIAPAAQAAESAPSLRWSISEQFVSHLSTRTLADGAAFDAEQGTFTFPADERRVAGDTVTYVYDGTVDGAFAMAGTEFYGVRISDPAVSVDTDGSGEITAEVSARNAAAQGNPLASTSPVRVTVAEFASSTSTDGVLAATPAWEGVLPADSDAALALGIAAGKPVSGGAFHPEFLGQLTAGVRAHFYASGSGSDAKKVAGSVAAGEISAAPKVTTSVAGARPSSGVDLKVTGTGFSATDGNPSDDGVYVGVARADAQIDFDDMDSGMAQMVGINWVEGRFFDGDTFSTVVNVPTANLKKGTKYALYTWRAHTHSTDSQDTVTPVSIPWARLTKVKAATKVAATKPTTKKAGKIAVTFGGKYGKAAGKAKVTVKKGAKKVGAVRTVTLNKAGKVNVKLAKAKKGTYTVAVKLLATPDYKATVVKRQYKVTT
ncbi:hypothetical protein [Nocardioides sp. zg-DK7169]|uniref:hypothetical protein n=1 Tax=Nocardioides sp. zg-DK7169 TaxID=2736600 RepID=UPI001557881B|nr:hypothetical protein [Nocardioides sp. zg-DK7169]NPC95681.1 hypothetical protein [Nocardioides sp. zg-DK7169]